MASNPIYIFAGGGSGGHLYPGIAAAEELVRLQPGTRVVFACSNRAIDRRILDPLPYGVVPQTVAPLPRRAGEVWPFLRAWFASNACARDMIRDLQPAAVLGLGGFAAGPIIRQAAKAGVRRALLNPDAVPGKANRYLARHVDVVFTQFDAADAHFPQALRGRLRKVGCPVRRQLAQADSSEARAFFDLRADRRVLLVLGGSQGAASINDAVAAMAGDFDALADSWQILHITGPGMAKRDDLPRAMHVRRIEYCDRMDLAYAAAELVLCRSGASTMAELSATGTPAVLVPYSHHADRQQELNAAPFVAAGSAVICHEADNLAANVAGLREMLLPILRDDAALGAMQDAARAGATPDAAEVVARWLAAVE